MDMHDTHERGLAELGCLCSLDAVKVGEEMCPEHGWQDCAEHPEGCWLNCPNEAEGATP